MEASDELERSSQNGLITLESGISLADQIYHLVALIIVLSILTHSSTDHCRRPAIRAQPTSDENEGTADLSARGELFRRLNNHDVVE